MKQLPVKADGGNGKTDDLGTDVTGAERKVCAERF